MWYAAQGIPQIDAEIAEKGHLWMETNLTPRQRSCPFGMGKDIPKNRSGNADTCSWNIDDALESLQDVDKKIREFLEQKKRLEKGQEDPQIGRASCRERV